MDGTSRFLTCFCYDLKNCKNIHKINLHDNEYPALTPGGSQCAGYSPPAWLDPSLKRIPKPVTTLKEGGVPKTRRGGLLPNLFDLFELFFFTFLICFRFWSSQNTAPVDKSVSTPLKLHFQSVHYMQHLGGVGSNPYTIYVTLAYPHEVSYIVYGLQKVAQKCRV